MKSTLLAAMAAMLCLGTMANTACALPPFKKAFAAKFADKKLNPDYARIVAKAGCNVCHVKGEEKEAQNAYGTELSKLIEGNAKQRLEAAAKNGAKAEEQEQLLGELAAAFPQVAEMKNAEGVKYGDLIKAGQLPVPVPPSAEGTEETEEDAP